ncbi:MAG: hypothetical protein ACT4NY_24995 [Pseudonocardiales bacterium]
MGQTLSTWPQLASDVALGGAMAANAVRRIALGELVMSGRYEVDLDVLVRDGSARPTPTARSWVPEPASVAAPVLPMPTPGRASLPTHDEVRFIVGCATLAPSGGNAQPWRFTCQGATLGGAVDGTRWSLLDFQGRASGLALGAALEAALIGARALGFVAQTVVHSGAPRWELTLQRADASAATPELTLLRERCCNRVGRPSPPIPPDDLAGLVASAQPLEVVTVTDPGALGLLGEALGELDRVRFLIDLASLELDATDVASAVRPRLSPLATLLLAHLTPGPRSSAG